MRLHRAKQYRQREGDKGQSPVEQAQKGGAVDEEDLQKIDWRNYQRQE